MNKSSTVRPRCSMPRARSISAQKVPKERAWPSALTGWEPSPRTKGEHDTAESLHKRALAIYEKTSGVDSVAVTAALEGLARIYKSQQKFADAEQLYQRVLKIDQSKLKPDDPGLLDDEADMAALYFAWDKPAQAAPTSSRISAG